MLCPKTGLKARNYFKITFLLKNSSLQQVTIINSAHVAKTQSFCRSLLKEIIVNQ